MDLLMGVHCLQRSTLQDTKHQWNICLVLILEKYVIFGHFIVVIAWNVVFLLGLYFYMINIVAQTIRFYIWNV